LIHTRRWTSSVADDARGGQVDLDLLRAELDQRLGSLHGHIVARERPHANAVSTRIR
jgi:hypothetical protein